MGRDTVLKNNLSLHKDINGKLNRQISEVFVCMYVCLSLKIRSEVDWLSPTPGTNFLR